MAYVKRPPAPEMYANLPDKSTLTDEKLFTTAVAMGVKLASDGFTGQTLTAWVGLHCGGESLDEEKFSSAVRASD